MALAKSLQKYIETVAPTYVYRDCPMNNNGGSGNTTTFPTTTAVSLGVVGANKRRLILAFPCKGYWTDGDLYLYVAGSPTANFNTVFLPIVDQLDELADLSTVSNTNVNQSTPTAWTEAGSATTGAGTDPGHNTDNSVRAVFGWTTSDVGSLTAGKYRLADTVEQADDEAHVVKNPSSGTLASVFNRADAAARAVGSAYFFVLACSEDESSTASVSITLLPSDNVAVSASPQYGGECALAPFDGLCLESDLVLGFAGGSQCDVTGVVGSVAPTTGDEFWMEYGSQAQFDSDSGYTATSHLDISALTRGKTFVRTIATYSESAPLNRPAMKVQGVTFKGQLAQTPQVPTLGDEQIDIYRGDSHEVVGWNDKVSDATEALQVQAATDAHINETIEASTGKVRSIRYHDGAWAFGQLTSASNQIFPLEADGSGIASGSATSHYALSQSDTDEIARAHRIKTPLRTRLTFQEYIRSNHDPFDKQFRDGFNSESNDAEGWATNTLVAHRVVPTGINTTTPVRAFLGEGSGRWYARPWGNYLHCVMNPGFESLYGATNAVSVPSPIPETMEDIADWTLGDTQFDFFLDPDSGIIKQYQGVLPWVVIDIHNIPGGTAGAVGQGILYGRFGPEDEGTGYWWDNCHPALVSLCAGRCIVMLAHDHNWDWYYKDGILYVWVPTPGEIGANGLGGSGYGPYGKGFIHNSSVGYIHQGANARPNAGWVELHSSPSSIRVKYKSTFITTAPTVVPMPPGFEIADNQLVAQVGWPMATSSGRSRSRTRCR